MVVYIVTLLELHEIKQLKQAKLVNIKFTIQNIIIFLYNHNKIARKNENSCNYSSIKM